MAISPETKRLRQFFYKNSYSLVKVFGSGWKSHTAYGILENGNICLEAFDGERPKRMRLAADGQVLWAGFVEDDGSRESARMVKVRTLLRRDKRKLLSSPGRFEHHASP
ncbi:hypothetical protein F6X40_10210 [Paraburkholderia sp. UCT31]|uniref:hypothetical protein n=1 Tax=Paraburkholderia sp. UCT31 TaxID=2615209 RepID=UPI001654FD72|nr:hypothetical protein [Paraburkholderia sp. UCT31]MBC8737181.1 hypothetical protein [Paraburkholderia sp. UCT31]